MKEFCKHGHNLAEVGVYGDKKCCNKCRKIAKARWLENNFDKAKEYQKKWNEENKSKKSEYNREWSLKHKDTDEFKSRQRNSANQRTAKLYDLYVKSRLRTKGITEITPELIELQKLSLQTHRALKTLKGALL